MKYVEPIRNWPLIPQETAILVVDVQKSEVSPDLLKQNKEYAEVLYHRMLPALTYLIENARQLGCEIIYTVIEALTKDGRDCGLDHKLSNIFIPKGSPLAKTLPEAKQQEDDILLKKTSSGVFNSTALAYILRNLGIKHVVVAGLLTDQCVDMSIRDGADLGFYMVCAHDACASRTQKRHEQALQAFGGYCRIQSVAEIIQDIERSGKV